MVDKLRTQKFLLKSAILDYFKLNSFDFYIHFRYESERDNNSFVHAKSIQIKNQNKYQITSPGLFLQYLNIKQFTSMINHISQFCVNTTNCFIFVANNNQIIIRINQYYSESIFTLMIGITRFITTVRMFTRQSLFSFTIVKAQLKSRQIVNQSQRIAQFMKFDVPNTANPQQIHSKLIKFLTFKNSLKKINEIKVTEMLEVERQLKIIQFMKQAVAKEFKEMNSATQVAIDNIYNFCVNILHQIDKQTYKKPSAPKSSTHRSYSSTIPMSTLVQVTSTINQLFPLISVDRQMYVRYMGSVTIFKKMPEVVPNGQFIPNLRVCVDELAKMDPKLFDQKSRIYLFKTIAHINLTILYYERALQLYMHFWQGIKNLWYKDITTRSSLYLVFKNVNFVTDDIIQKNQQLLIEYTKKPASTLTDAEMLEAQRLLQSLVRYKKINRSNYADYRSLVAKIVEIHKDKQDEFFQYLVQSFFMAGIWMVEFWVPFMNYLKVSKGRSIQFYHMYVLNQLLKLEKQQIPAEIHNASTALQELIATDQKFQKKEELIQDYNRKQTSNKTTACQTQLANALRILNTGNVRTEHFIDFFCVDIIVDNEFIIEVNGNMHILNHIDKGTKEYNIKTQFRSRILNKLGYNVIDIDLDQFAEASFKLIEIINQIIARKKGDPNKEWICLSMKQ